MMFSMLLKYNRLHAARKSSRLAVPAQRSTDVHPKPHSPSPEPHPHKQINQSGTESNNPHDNPGGSRPSISGFTSICRRLGLQP